MNTRAWRIKVALADMSVEAQRALDKHGSTNTMDAPDKTDGERLAILMEEVGEAAHELTYDAGKDDLSLDPAAASRERLRKELIQVGAMAATWAAMLG